MKNHPAKTIWRWRRNYAFLLLLPILATANPADSTRSRLLCERGVQYRDRNLDSSFYYFNQALALSRSTRDSVGMARALLQLGQTHLFNTKDEAKATNVLRQGLTIAKATNDNLHLAKIYQWLAVIAYHQHIGNGPELLAMARQHAQKSGSRMILAEVCETQYDYLRLMVPPDFRQMESVLQEAMTATYQYDMDHWFTFGLDYCALLERQNRTAEVRTLARRLASQTHTLQKKYGEFVYYNDLARLALKLTDYKRAETILRDGLAQERRSAKPDTLHLYFYYKNLNDTYKQQQNWPNAYQVRDTLATIQLWLQQKRQSRDAKLQMTQQKAAFDLDRKQTEIDLLNTRQQQQRLYLIGSIALLTLLIGFAVVQQRSRKRIERQRTQLSLLNTRLTEVNTTKDKLFAILSHDLRAPMANITGYLMLQNWGALSPAEFDPLARSLAQRIEHLQTMLNNVLNWAMSQMNGIRPQPESVALAPLVAEKFRLLQPLADAKGIELLHDVSLTDVLYIDKHQLNVILQNLLQNALKFTNAGGQVTVSYVEQEGKGLLTVTDTGIGIAPDLVLKLFRLDGKPSKPGTAGEPGTGLGLVLVKELTEANGGSLHIQSEEGKGSRFTVALPLPPIAP